MKFDESAIVKQALSDAREQLQQRGRIYPAAYMLVSNNPQTGAPLTHPTAIGAVQETPFASQAEYDAFLDTLRAEVVRLGATAVALAGEANAEVETKSGVETRRVFYLRVEDQVGVEQLHAPIEKGESGVVRLGKLLADAGAADILDAPLLPRRS
ncbi:MAG: hypothetical protein ABW321_07735 [Polyangiales bacterium]